MKHLCDFLKLNSNFPTILLWQHNLDYVRAKLEHKRLLTIQKSIKSFLHNKSELERNFSSKIIGSKYKCYVVRSFVEGKLKFIVANWKLDLFLNINANQVILHKE